MAALLKIKINLILLTCLVRNIIIKTKKSVTRHFKIVSLGLLDCRIVRIYYPSQRVWVYSTYTFRATSLLATTLKCFLSHSVCLALELWMTLLATSTVVLSLSFWKRCIISPCDSDVDLIRTGSLAIHQIWNLNQCHYNWLETL